jgi:ATP-dependent RNA helicase DDX24/MAK5
MIHDGEEYLVQCGCWTRFLVLDEADRMLETGHFAELEHIVGRFTHSSEAGEVDRYTMLFSATLTVDPREWVRLKRRVGKAPVKRDTSPLAKMIMAMPFQRPQMETVDLSSQSLVASRVTEYKLMCSREEKDAYLYYLLCTATEERTLVFVNAIETVRRIINLLTLLRVPAFPLHAELQQRQRLRNLDRFRAQSCGVLVATDVAARGIDVPAVQQVVHYQLPRTVEVYVHRCGRTARGSVARGHSVALLGEADLVTYRRLLAAVHRQSIPDAPLSLRAMKPVRQRIAVAHRIDRLTRQQSSKSRSTAFLRKAARDMDIDMDGLDVLSSEEEEDQDERANRNALKNRRFKREVGELRAELETLLRQPLERRHPASAASTVQSISTNRSRIRKGGILQSAACPQAPGGFLPISTSSGLAQVDVSMKQMTSGFGGPRTRRRGSGGGRRR